MACPARRVTSAATAKSFDQALGPYEQSFMTVTPAVQYHMLGDSLRLVAAPPEAQVSALPDFVCLTCEISTLYTDAYLLVPQLEEASLVTADTGAARYAGSTHSSAKCRKTLNVSMAGVCRRIGFGRRLAG
jgi:hypothetical protein